MGAQYTGPPDPVIVGAIPAVSSVPLAVLVVEPALNQLLATVSALAAAGFHVTAADNFAQAKHLLTSSSPSVLLTALRLGMYNGLHLVVRGKALRPSLSAIVTSPEPEAGLQGEAERLGATFIQIPVCTRNLIAAIIRTTFRPADETPIQPPYERRLSERRTAMSSPAPVSVERRVADRRRVLPWLFTHAK